MRGAWCGWPQLRLAIDSRPHPDDRVTLNISVRRKAVAKPVGDRIVSEPQRQPHGDTFGVSSNHPHMRRTPPEQLPAGRAWRSMWLQPAGETCDSSNTSDKH
jgi:hypothetical protein